MQFHEWFYSEEHRQKYDTDHPAYLAAEEAWIAARAHLSLDRMADFDRQERLRRYMDKETPNETP
jgi:spore coat polysaccharide biosynthesis protein SpsF (cytidylyltransferase family)